jgi:hypothetical protein
MAKEHLSHPRGLEDVGRLIGVSIEWVTIMRRATDTDDHGVSASIEQLPRQVFANVSLRPL